MLSFVTMVPDDSENENLINSVEITLGIQQLYSLSYDEDAGFVIQRRAAPLQRPMRPQHMRTAPQYAYYQQQAPQQVHIIPSSTYQEQSPRYQRRPGQTPRTGFDRLPGKVRIDAHAGAPQEYDSRPRYQPRHEHNSRRHPRATDDNPRNKSQALLDSLGL